MLAGMNTARRDPTAVALGRRIRQARAAAGMTQEGLALALGVTRGNIAQYENGLRQPDIAKLRAIARALGVTQAELLGDVPLRPTPLEQAAALAERILGAQRGVPIPHLGRVPAAAAGWVRREGAEVTVEIPRLWAEASRRALLAVEVGDDSLRAAGILPGDIVVLARLDPGERPRPGSLVLARAGDLCLLGYWEQCPDGQVVLRDAAGLILARLRLPEDAVLGVYYALYRPPAVG
jgi:transcriptional regulator with XRE-family HTH domain